MATLSFNAGVYNSNATKTVNSSLTLSGANTAADVPGLVLRGTGNVTNLSAFGLLYDDPGTGVDGDGNGYGALQRTITLSKDGFNTTFTTRLTAANTKMAIIDKNGLTVTFTITATSGDSTVFPDLTGSVNAVGPEHRRKYLLGY